jgi:hypothetical protein
MGDSPFIDSERRLPPTARLINRDGGHGNLPIRGHLNSPLVATGSPQGWPPDLPTSCPERPVLPTPCQSRRVEEAGLKKAEEVMEILEAYDLVT